MNRILVLGSGKIGRMIARFLASSGDYRVRVADADAASIARLTRGEIAGDLHASHADRRSPAIETLTLDVTKADSLSTAMRDCDAVVSALSFHHNPGVASAALEAGVSYFDLTEDIATTKRVRELAGRARAGQIFMPQCGLAPGFVSIAANSLAGQFDQLDRVHMRVGALPQFPTGALRYNLTWSTDGLINEYCNLCEAIHDGGRTMMLPLEGLEHFSLDGVRYEAFNTSGGLGSLCETFEGRVRELNYKTIRYHGHRDAIALLVQELRLSERRDLLKDILESAVPITFQDVVVIFCTVAGWRNGQFVQVSDARKVYNESIFGENWSAIQITTAAGICAAVDMHFAGRLPDQGFVRQEAMGLDDFLANRFGRRYDAPSSTRFARQIDSQSHEPKEESHAGHI